MCIKGEMSVEPAPKVYLQNRLSRCRAKIEELDVVLNSKRKSGALRLPTVPIGRRCSSRYVTCAGREAEQLKKLVAAYSSDTTLGNVNEVLDVSLPAVNVDA